jgi:predicted  nucleic acid-binding Zn-ribbon protein
MGCKMPWWAGSETPPQDKDKIISDLRAEVASLKEERDKMAVELLDKSLALEQVTQQLAAANGRVERQAQVIAEALHELDSSVVDWDSPVMRASQLLQAEVDAALSNLNEDSAG